MNYGVIDLGANTVRLSVYGVCNDQIVKIFTKKIVAGLAAYVVNGHLTMEGMLKACEVLDTLKKVAGNVMDLNNLHVFATASLRNILNSDEAVEIIQEKTGLSPDILSYDEEASMGFTGISRAISCENGLMMDIGGASTEFVHIQNYKAVDFASVPIGCLNLYVNNVKNIIPTEEERKAIRNTIKTHLAKVEWDVNYPTVICVGGTARASLKLSQTLFRLPKSQNQITLKDIKQISCLIKESGTDNNYIHHTIYKTVPERTLTLFTGLAILKRAMKKFGSETMIVSQQGVREGYLIDRVLNKNGKSSQLHAKQGLVLAKV